MPIANISTGNTPVLPVQTPQINIRDVLQSNRQMNQALLDNIQLHEALADELGVSDKRNKAAASGYDLQAKQNQDQLGLEPKMVQAKSAQLDRDIAVTPAQTSVDLGNLNTQLALQPGDRAVGLNQQLLTREGQTAAVPQANFLANESLSDPSGGLTKTRQQYESIFGAPAKKDDGSVDYDSMQSMNNQVAAAKLRAMMMQANAPITKDLFDQLKERGRMDLAFNSNGTLRMPADIANDLKNLPAPVNPEQAQKAMADYNSLNEGLKKLNDLQTIINDPTHNVVGPAMGQGDVVGQGMAKARAWIGGDQTKLADQQKVQQAIAQQLGDMMRNFSGIRNQKEFNALGERIPSMTNNRDNWNSYINDAKNTVQSALSAIQQGLPAGTKVDPTYQAPAKPSASPNLSNRPVIKSQADYDKLPAGTPYVDSYGKPGTKH